MTIGRTALVMTLGIGNFLGSCGDRPVWHEAPGTPAAETYAECWADRSNRPCVAGKVLFEKDGTAHPVVILWSEPNGRKRVVRE